MATEATRVADEIVIRPSTHWVDLGAKELWRARELLYFLTVRDLKVRYKQTLLGIVWAVIQPVMYMVVFTLFFSKVTTLYTAGQEYAPLALTGSVIWLFFANSVTLASTSLVGSSALITKVYFPRLLQTASPVIAALVDLALSSTVMLAIMVAYGYFPGVRVLVVIPFLLLAIATAIGVGAWLAALNVKYRDVRFVVPFMLQLLLIFSAAFYEFEGLNLEEPWATLFFVNPVAGVVEGFRWAFIGGLRPDVTQIAVSTMSGFVILVAGLVYFKRMESVFADIV